MEHPVMPFGHPVEWVDIHMEWHTATRFASPLLTMAVRVEWRAELMDTLMGPCLRRVCY